MIRVEHAIKKRKSEVEDVTEEIDIDEPTTSHNVSEPMEFEYASASETLVNISEVKKLTNELLSALGLNVINRSQLGTLRCPPPPHFVLSCEWCQKFVLNLC